MKFLLASALIFLLMISTALSLPVNTNIVKNGSEELETNNTLSQSEIITNEILSTGGTATSKESTQLAAGTGNSNNSSTSSFGMYHPSFDNSAFADRKVVEYEEGHIIPEPVTIILLGLGLTGLAFRRKL